MDCRFCKEDEPVLLDADGVRLAATRVVGDCWVDICLDDAYWAHAVDDTWMPCARKAAEEHAIVDKLPKTADGVYWIPGTDVEFYHPREAGLHDDVDIEDGRWVAWWWTVDRATGGSTGRCYGVNECQSTPKAAEAARDG